MRLQQKILLIILPLILIPIIVLGGFAYKYSLDTQDKLEQIQLTSDIKRRISKVTSYTRHSGSAVGFLSMNQALISALSQNVDGNVLQNIQNEFTHFSQVYPETRQLTLLNKDGDVLSVKTLGDDDSQYDNRLPLSKRMHWQLVSQVEKSELLVGIQHPIFKPGTGSNKALIGFVNVLFMPDWPKKLKLREHQGDKFMISDLSGNLLFSYPLDEMGSTIPNNAFKKLYNTTKQSQSAILKLGSNQLYFSGQLVAHRYLFLYGQDQGLIQKDKSSITLVALITVVVTVMITLLLLYYFIHKLVILPIMELAQAKQQVSQGEFDIKLTPKSDDEFSELFSSFNIMVSQLVVYREKEREGRLRLEYKVKERTEELLATNLALESSNAALEKAKIASEQANTLKSSFVANISHEIRTPLTAILGFTEQVIVDSSPNRHQLDLLGRVLISGKHLLALINNVLDVSKIESGKLDIEVTKVDLFELFNDVISLLSTQAADKNLEFIFNYVYPIPHYIRTDSTRLKQILINLASNAIKFTESGSIKIDVSYKADDSSINVEVTDTGIGMEQDVVENIFQPFMQADVSISRRFGGTGLGLVISKNLAELLGGSISVSSELGKGSKFTFDFKIEADEQPIELELINSLIDLATDQGQVFGFSEKIIEHSDSSSEQNKDKRAAQTQQTLITKQVQTPLKDTAQPLTGRVLVAEDVEDNQYLFKLLLDSLKIEYDIVSNGEQAVEKALKQEFDLILMDMQMPIIGGLEATSILRQAGIDIPIYALTANVMKDDLQKHLDAGCNGTIAKPINRQEFIAIVQTVLKKSQLDSQQQTSSLPENKFDRLKKDYLSQLPAQCDIIKSHVIDMNFDNTMRELHKIKGSAGSYDFMIISDLAEQIESFCLKNKDSVSLWSDLKPRIAELLITINELNNEK